MRGRVFVVVCSRVPLCLCMFARVCVSYPVCVVCVCVVDSQLSYTVGYMMHPHRHCHLSPPGVGAQTIHKDSYFSTYKARHHRPYWAMAMYYPQEVTTQNGATGVVPYSQYLTRHQKDRMANIPADWSLEEIQAVAPAGSVVIIHYDIFHRGRENNTNADRFMFKVRMYECVLCVCDFVLCVCGDCVVVCKLYALCALVYLSAVCCGVCTLYACVLQARRCVWRVCLFTPDSCRPLMPPLVHTISSSS